MEVTRDQWVKLLKISKRYDMDNEVSPYPFHFNYNGGTILALDKQTNDITFELIPEYAEVWSFKSFRLPDNKMQICWSVPSSESRSHVLTHQVWTAYETFCWIKKLLR